jgi:hypothetical protein
MTQYNTFTDWYWDKIVEVNQRLDSFPQNEEPRTKEELHALLKNLERGWRGVIQKEFSEFKKTLMNP